ncbi:MAG: hypothetical protein EZS28_048196 [Streblomastix strix]|uniref:Uncharacterized protein n=1 Tax=Streblomastix strix TaxID=222440 RepID=A0A5J4TDK5_9EUKA|nr:MAG: hypothetical protein EZS28_048196 [Streblomastix strix]
MDDNLTLKAASHSLFRKQKYDPIVGQFISEKLDKEDWDKRSSSAKKLQSQKLRDLPPCVQTREENSVDVISNQVKDPKAFREQEDKKQDWIQRRGLTVRAVADKKQGV